MYSDMHLRSNDDNQFSTQDTSVEVLQPFARLLYVQYVGQVVSFHPRPAHFTSLHLRQASISMHMYSMHALVLERLKLNQMLLKREA